MSVKERYVFNPDGSRELHEDGVLVATLSADEARVLELVDMRDALRAKRDENRPTEITYGAQDA